ncbi:hypothetical protein MU448_08885 [Streptococcus sp. O1]|uniref:hypothetical protein n=1 Tax=Streptococcus sp. O1 TaxID=2928735 RepID=UPI00211B09D1|nr:hypothetical protein [Streptococcus sp. O1]MCQ9214513.1 hypothetical protein [Streptococcus sp. O1]
MDFLIRGISKKDMDYLKSLARENSLSLNQFLLHILQEYCEQKQVHQTEKLYLNYLEEMKEITCMLLKKEEAESECLVRLEKMF